MQHERLVSAQEQDKGALGRRAFLHGVGALLALGLAGCATQQAEEAGRGTASTAAENERERDGLASDAPVPADQGEVPVQIQITVNDTPFTATVEDTSAGQKLLERLPCTLAMEELHGNEKYCYTGEAFGGEAYVPETIEAGDLMVFGNDCLVLFYETFANDGWSYTRVGKVDDPTGLADACGSGTATVTFSAAV